MTGAHDIDPDEPLVHHGMLEGQAVEVRVASGGLVISGAGQAIVWPYSSLRVTHVQPARFVHQHEALEITGEVAGSGLLDEIARANPEAFQKLSGNPMSSPWTWIGVTAVAVVAFVWISWVWGIPALAGVMASRVPVSWEEKLGSTVETSFLATSGECTAPGPKRAIEEIVRRLDGAKPSDYKFRVKISNSGEMNAFAAPGGHIVVLRGLMERADTPEEVAGVLAHEMEHVRQRHVTRGLFRQMTVSALFAMIFGDTGSIGSMAQGLGSLQFQREDEASADREGMRNLAEAGIDPQWMISFFGKLRKQETDMPRMAEYFSSHPDTQGRIEALEKLAGELRVHEKPLESRATWLQTRGLCK